MISGNMRLHGQRVVLTRCSQERCSSWAEDDRMQNVLRLCIAQCAPSEVCVGMPKVWLQSITLAHSNCLNLIKEHH